MDNQTTDIMHFAVAFHYYVTIKALETLWNTGYYLWLMKNNGKVHDIRSLEAM